MRVLSLAVLNPVAGTRFRSRVLELRQPGGQQRFELRRLLRSQAAEESTFVRRVLSERAIDESPSFRRESDHPAPPVGVAGAACDESRARQPVDAFRHRTGRDHGELSQLARSSLEGSAGTAQGCEDIEVSFPQTVFLVHGEKLLGEKPGKPVKPADHTEGPHVEVGTLAVPCLLNPGNVISGFRHGPIIASEEAIMTSMEATIRWSLVTAMAPIAWGTTYFVTLHFLPPDYPLYGAVLRALPAGLLLLVIRRRLPRGSWWWKSLVLGTLNMGAFFALVYLAAQLLPTSVASTIMATSPIVMMAFAWSLLAERPRALPLAGAVVGIVGVCVMLLTSAGGIDLIGVLASVAAMLMSSIGYVLTKRWSTDVEVLSLTSWQLIAGGVVLVPFAIAVEGSPPALSPETLLGFGYVSIVATAVAFGAWFSGLRHLSAGTVGLIGLLNPVTGVLLGTIVAGETLTVQQVLGLFLVLLGILLGQPVLQWIARSTRSPLRSRTSVDHRIESATDGALAHSDQTSDRALLNTNGGRESDRGRV